MTLPLTTTRISISRTTGGGDKWEPGSTSTTTLDAPANISSPTAAEQESAQTAQELIDMVMHVDPWVDVKREDSVTDLVLNETYEVVWVVKRHGLGLDHVRAGLRRTAGD